MKQKRILITGSSGFIGSHLVTLLKNEYMLVDWDIKQLHDLFQIDNLNGISAVIHLAALTNVRESNKKPEEYMRLNVLGTAHMLRLCADYKTKFIYLSSAAVEDVHSSVYALSKFTSETLILSMQKSTNALVFRPYNIYGINGPKDSLFNNFLTKPKLTIYGDGTDTRDFMNVWDLVRIIKSALDNDWHSIYPIAIGTGKNYTVKQIAEIFAKYTKKPIEYINKLSGISHSIADTTMLRRYYKEPFITNIDSDIDYLVKYYKENSMDKN